MLAHLTIAILLVALVLALWACHTLRGELAATQDERDELIGHTVLEDEELREQLRAAFAARAAGATVVLDLNRQLGGMS